MSRDSVAGKRSSKDGYNTWAVITNLAGTTQGFSGDGGAALSAQLNGPEALASAEDRVFIADTKNDRIRRVNVLTGVIDTIIGDGGLTTSITLDDPEGVAVGGGEIGVSNTGRQTLVTATINPDTGDEQEEFTPTQSCGIVPGVSSIDWALPVVLLGVILARKRIVALFIRLGSATGMIGTPVQ